MESVDIKKFERTMQRSQQNVGLIALSVVRSKFSSVYNMLRHYLDQVKDFVIRCVYVICQDKKGRDIALLQLQGAEHLEGYDQIMQGHFDRFNMKMLHLFDNKNREKTLESFKKNILKRGNIYGLGSLYFAIHDNPIPGVTKKDESVARKLYDISREKPGYKELHKKLSLRDIKTFHNVAVKCMNYAIQTNNQDFIQQLCYLHEIFNDYLKYDPVSQDHLDQLKSNKDFIALLQMIKDYYEKIDESKRVFSIQFLIDYFLNGLMYLPADEVFSEDRSTCFEYAGNPRRLEYRDIQSLIMLADDTYRSMHEVRNMTPLESNICILKTSYNLTLVKASLMQIINKMRKDGNFSEEHLRDLLAQYRLDIRNLAIFVECLPFIVYKTTEFIGLGLADVLYRSHKTW